MSVLRTGEVLDPRVGGDDPIAVEKPGGKSALRESVQTVPALDFFLGS